MNNILASHLTYSCSFLIYFEKYDSHRPSNESDDYEYDQGGHNAGGDNEHLLGKWGDAEQDGRLINHWGGKYG